MNLFLFLAVLVSGGTFQMGSTTGGPDCQPLHRVTISPFYMDDREVTQESFNDLMGVCPAKFEGDNLPVERVRWTQAAKYCNARSRKEGLTPCYDEKTWQCNFDADGYRLPTEAEWEYACRAGTTTAYSFGNDAAVLKTHGWFKGNADKTTHPVGAKPANAWGLFDMHGNVAEWCNDFYAPDYYQRSPATDPRGPTEGTKRVLRGGHWSATAEKCTSFFRMSDAPGLPDVCLGYELYGFRCVRRAASKAGAVQTSGQDRRRPGGFRSDSDRRDGGVPLVRADKATSLRQRLQTTPFRITHECYTNNNWEIFVSNADGSAPVNLTQTPKVHEHYPQVSPDGAKICFSVDEGEGRDTVRSLWVMDSDGSRRRKLADNAREPFWCPDSKAIGYLPQEFPKFNVTDYYTTGMSFCDLATGKITPHMNSTNLHHLYNPCFARNGKWIVSTVHAGMGFKHGILLIEARGNKIINLNIPGCRPCFSPDGKQIAWGAGDHKIAAAPINLDADAPSVGPWRLTIKDETNKIYHVDWSPDSRFLCFSRGPNGKGDPTKPGTFAAACEIVGVHAAGWDLGVVSAERDGELDLKTASDVDFIMLTTNGCSNKEPSWFRKE
jgi:formylglycine-generating enzyme required for sulfatase activity